MKHILLSRTRRVGTVALLAALLSACSSMEAPETAKDDGAKEISAAMMRAGEKSKARGEYSAAVGFFRRAHEASPEDIAPLSGLGEAMVAAGLAKEAANAFRKALVIDPANPRALRGLGNALVAQDQLDLAVEQFEKALAVNGKDHRAYSGLGVAYDSMAKHDKAQEFYYAGLEIAPSDVLLRNNLGLSLAFSGHFNGAIEILRPLALRPGATARDRQNLALAYGLSGDMKQAKQFARMDMDSRSVERNLNYYAALRSISDPVLRIKSVRAGYAPQPR